jgi:hypothetical protein
MSSRPYIKHTVSTSTPTITQVGDEWFNPATNTLSKVVVSNGNTVAWNSSIFSSSSAPTFSVTGTTTLNSVTVSGTVNLGSVSSVKITGGSASQYLQTDGAGNLSFASVSGGAAISADNTTNTNAYYPVFTATTSGTMSSAAVANTKLYYNPSTGTLNSTVFNSLSDETVKTNKERIIDALSKLLTLGGYTYLLVDSNEPSAGLLAQEVQKVLPQAVKFNPDTGLLSLNYNAVLGMVVEALNELEKRVTGLENGR